MALQTSGQMTLDDIAAEFGLSTGNLTLDACAIAAGVSTSNCVLPDSFYGKSAATITLSPNPTNLNVEEDGVSKYRAFTSTITGNYESPATSVWSVSSVTGVWLSVTNETFTSCRVYAEGHSPGGYLAIVTHTVNGSIVGTAQLTINVAPNVGGGGANPK